MNTTRLGYESKNWKESSCKIVDLELEMLEFKDPYEEMIDQDNIEDEDLSLETLFLNDMESNIFEIIEIPNQLLEEMYFD